MSYNHNFKIKHIVMVGGGHSNAIALRLLGLNPLPHIQITLITNTPYTPYSGMLPGHIAGFYTFEETHINLVDLANFAKAELIIDEAIDLDLTNHQVICQNHAPVTFDYLSIDIGSTPAKMTVKGALEYAIPAKPVSQFLQAWNQILTTAAMNSQQPVTISIVGGGAGGVELALNMHHRLQQILSPNKLTIHLFDRHQRLLANHNQLVSQTLENILINRGINIHLSENVGQVLPHQIICDSGLTIPTDYTFWVTQASTPEWIKNSALTTDTQGFILVSNTLQSLSHPHVFATGDIATIQNYSRPKAGVFAVRQGKPLFNNIQNIILGKTLQFYIPQPWYLSLIGTGDQQAIASWGYLAFQSPLFWYWKDYIDRKFMKLFEFN